MGTEAVVSRVALVTGAGGFVGSAVVRLLVKSIRSGDAPVDHVAALLRPGGSIERLKELPSTKDWSIHQTDLANRQDLERLLARVRPRAIVHTALDASAYGDVPEADRHRMNIAPLETLFRGLSGAAGARLVHTGSAWVLPSGDKLAEDVAVEPRSVYAECKAAADRWLPLHGEKAGVPWINLRLFNVFGKYEKPSRLLPYLVSRLAEGKEAHLSHGSQVRDFNDVDDIAQAYLLALRAPESACGRIYHIGSGRGTTARDFAMEVARLTGNGGLLRFDASYTPDQDLPCLVADPSLGRRVLGWQPQADLESRIGRAVGWWLDRRNGTAIPQDNETGMTS